MGRMGRYEYTDEQRKVLEGLPQPFAVYQFLDKRVATLILSDGFCKLFGYANRSAAYYDMDTDMYKDTHPDDVARIAEAAFRFATEGGDYEVVYRTKDKERGGYRIVHAMGKHLYSEGVRLAHVWYTDEGPFEADEPDQATGLNRSLAEALREDGLVRASCYDEMTGLPTMSYFFELAEAGKKTIRERGGEPVLLFTDLSGMKIYNTQNGFAEGNRLIREFATLLKDTFSNENCCRISGDHFAVYTEETGLKDVLRRLFAQCEDLNDGHSLPLRVGIYSGSMGDVLVSEACDAAKFACDSLRNAYGSRFAYYDECMRSEVERRMYVLANVNRALEEGWIKVLYQPIVRALNGRVCNEEALSRWNDPELGMLSPLEYIPALEEAGVMYKVDLFVLENVLKKMQAQQERGLDVVPTSINLSRSDFTACDIVSEIVKRVDESPFPRNMIAVEVTESVIGKDFDFMVEQVKRLRDMGFPVWMDDFGSGYSSIDLLQSIEFDLIKFDMSFMRRLDEGDSAKTVLNELVKMATSLGVDTLCEGVETEGQKRFVREVGCSKMQGYLFCRPVTFEQILERYENSLQIGFENPDESAYYDAIGSVNLYDLAVMANEDDELRNYVDALPMGVMEIDGDAIEYVRTNQSYRDFMDRFFQIDVNVRPDGYRSETFGADSPFVTMVSQCCEEGGRAFFDEVMADGSAVHSFIRHIGANPVSGKNAVVVVVLSVSEPREGATYANVVRALAADYHSIYYVDLDTDDFIEYSLRAGGNELVMERHGGRFFEAARNDAAEQIHEDDRARFVDDFSKEHLVHELNEKGFYVGKYRIMVDGDFVDAVVKGMRLRSGGNQVIIGTRKCLDI